MDPKDVLPIAANIRYVSQSVIQLISRKQLLQVLEGFSHLLARTCFFCRLLWACRSGCSNAPCGEVLWHPAPACWPCWGSSVLWWQVLPWGHGGSLNLGVPSLHCRPAARRQGQKLMGSPGHGAAKKQFSFLSPSINCWFCKVLGAWGGRDLMPRGKTFPPCFPGHALSPQSHQKPSSCSPTGCPQPSMPTHSWSNKTKTCLCPLASSITSTVVVGMAQRPDRQHLCRLWV